jgi:hypothetical protein
MNSPCVLKAETASKGLKLITSYIFGFENVVRVRDVVIAVQRNVAFD